MSWTLLKDIFAWIGALASALFVINLLIGETSKLNGYKRAIISWLGKRFKHRGFKKAAIEADIAGNINEFIFDLQKELPPGWLPRVSIDWRHENSPEKMADGDLILRMKPLENQDQNFLTVLNTFFERSLYPGSQTILPEDVQKASTLFLSQRTLKSKKPYLESLYIDDFMEPATYENPVLATLLGKYRRIDERGFFTGAYLRQVQKSARDVQFDERRVGIENELDQILDHMNVFADKLIRRGAVSNGDMWYRESPSASYTFLLVARIGAEGVGPYVRRAQEALSRGGERLYVFGAKEQKSFFRKVVSAISSLPEYVLSETFALNKDFRGLEGGLGAALENKTSRNEE